MAFMEPYDQPGKALSEMFNRPDQSPEPPNVMEDAFILATVMQDVRKAESQARESSRSTILDRNLNLYLAYVPKERWEGTNKARSSLSVPLVLEHSNAVNAQVMDIMFEDDPPFEMAANPGTSEMERRANQVILAWELGVGEVEMEMDGISLSGLVHGTTVAKASWQPHKNGYLCPRLDFVERKHMIVDPACRWPDIRTSGWRAHRSYISMAQLKKLRDVLDSNGQPAYRNIPSDEELKTYGIEPREQPAFSASENNNYINLTPEFDQQPRYRPTSIDPRRHPFEVLEYQNDEYLYTVLDGKRVIRSIYDPKQYMCRYFSGFFVRVEGQFDGVGHAFLIGDEQRLQQGLINNTLDNFSLSMHGFFFTKNNSSPFPQNISISPGKAINFQNPKEDVVQGQIPSYDKGVFSLLDLSDQHAARRTGANEVAVQGSFPTGSGGVGRTAQGMSLIGQASSARMRKYTRVLEEQIFVPYLEYLADTNPLFLDKRLAQQILGDELGRAYSMADVKALLRAGSKIKFAMLGALKMKRREAMLKSVPYITELLQNEFIQQSLRDQRLKTDVNEMLWLITDATGYPVKGNVIIPMSAAEKKALDRQNQMVEQLTMMRAQTQIQTDAEIQKSDAQNAGRAWRDINKIVMQEKVKQSDAQDQADYEKGMAAANAEMDKMMAGGGGNGPVQ